MGVRESQVIGRLIERSEAPKVVDVKDDVGHAELAAVGAAGVVITDVGEKRLISRRSIGLVRLCHRREVFFLRSGGQRFVIFGDEC